MEIKTFKKAADHIRKLNLLEMHDRIIAGVSGGADSMCMLMTLLGLKQEFDLDIIVAHVNHGIRGEEAERDAKFVRDYCENRGLPFELANADIPTIAKKTGTTCEEAGRNFRYEFFCELALKHNAKKIAVAHNSDDNAETVLFNMFRGSGISGLKGILPIRIITGKDGKQYTLIRPVLSLTRSEIEEGLKEAGQDFCIDRTNSEDIYARNMLRNVILPRLKESINSNAYGHIGNLSRQAAMVFDYIEQETDRYSSCIKLIFDEKGNKTGTSIDIPGLEKLHQAIRMNLIRRAFEMTSGKLKDVEEGHIEAIDALRLRQSGKRISLPYEVTAVREYDSIILTTSASGTGVETGQAEVSETSPGNESYGITWEIRNRSELPNEIPKVKDIKWFDHEKTGNDLTVRTCREGDYLLIGKELHKKSLSRFMIDNKIPLHERENIPLLANGSHVLWVAGYRQDESCLVMDSTERVLVVKKNF